MFRRLIAALVLSIGYIAGSIANAAERAISALDRPLREHLAMLGMTLLAGFVSWTMKVRKGEFPPASLMHFIGEVAASVLAGALGGIAALEWFGLSGGQAMGVSGLCGLMGARALERGEKMLLRFLDKWTKG